MNHASALLATKEALAKSIKEDMSVRTKKTDVKLVTQSI